MAEQQNSSAAVSCCSGLALSPADFLARARYGAADRVRDILHILQLQHATTKQQVQTAPQQHQPNQVLLRHCLGDMEQLIGSETFWQLQHATTK